MTWERVLLIAIGVILGNAIRDFIAWCVDENGAKPFIEDEEVEEVKVITPQEVTFTNMFDGTKWHPIIRCEDCPFMKKGEAE